MKSGLLYEPDPWMVQYLPDPQMVLIYRDPCLPIMMMDVNTNLNYFTLQMGGNQITNSGW